MIRNTIKKHKFLNTILLWIAIAFLISFLSFSSLSNIHKDNFSNLLNNIRLIDVHTLEMVTSTKRMLLEMDDSMIERIQSYKVKLHEELIYLKIHGNDSYLDKIIILEENIFKLFENIDMLILIEKKKKKLMDDIRIKISYIDGLLQKSDENFFDGSIYTFNIDKEFYKFDIILSKLARELGMYLKTDDKSALENIEKYFIALKDQKKVLNTFSLKENQLRYYNNLLMHVDEKNANIHKIIVFNEKKTRLLKQLGNLTDTINAQIAKDFNQILKEKSDKNLILTKWSMIIFIALFITLMLFFILSSAFLKGLSRIIEDGFAQLFAATKQVSRNEKISKISFKEDYNEFQRIGKSMIQMQESLDMSNLSKCELENILASIGDFRFIINSDESITFISENLISMLNYSKNMQIDTSILGSSLSFSTVKGLIKLGLLNDFDWHLVDRNRNLHEVKLTGIVLSSTSMFIIGKQGDKREKDDVINGHVLINAYGKICDFNFSYQYKLFNYRELDNKSSFQNLFDNYTIDKNINLERIKLQVKESNEIELTLTKNDTGEKYYLFLNVYELFSESAYKANYVLVLQDITRIISKDKFSLRLSKYDALTGLFSRASLFSKISELVSPDISKNHTFGLLIISLSQFSEVNDTLGYEIGDKLLVHLSNELKVFFKNAQIIARLGGDEFAVICEENIGTDEITKRTTILLERLNKAVKISNHNISIHVHVGISVYPDDGLKAKILLREANIALNRAKTKMHMFSFSNANESKTIIQKMEISQSLHQAIKNKEFSLCYQPQVNSETKTITGLEALIRWEHPRFGNISPSVFIPIAEESDIINELGLWVFLEVCKQINIWKDSGYVCKKIAVNISAKHFESENFSSDVIDIVEKYKVEPKYIQIEITESQFQNIDYKQDSHHRTLVNYGFTVAIDDFGTGFSSLVLLRRFYIHTIKVDKYFIDDIETDENARALLSGILDIAKSLGLTVIIEGVETEEQLKILRKIGYCIFQGYYYSKPIRPNDVAKFKLL